MQIADNKIFIEKGIDKGSPRVLKYTKLNSKALTKRTGAKRFLREAAFGASRRNTAYGL